MIEYPPDGITVGLIAFHTLLIEDYDATETQSFLVGKNCTLETGVWFSSSNCKISEKLVCELT